VEFRRIKEGGYLLLQVSQGEAAYHATLSDPSEQRVFWDSRRLAAGDLYSVLVLVPGTYSIRNDVTGIQARMHVQHGPESGRRPSGPKLVHPVYVTCREDRFDPAEWHSGGVQPIVLATEGAANFTIQLQQEIHDQKSKPQRLAEERDHLMRALANRKKRGKKLEWN
jgi:hypothetical protein